MEEIEIVQQFFHLEQKIAKKFSAIGKFSQKMQNLFGRQSNNVLDKSD